ncbi:MAG: hypothetical protein ACC645_25510, partial [Pirellulales bacterium]
KISPEIWLVPKNLQHALLAHTNPKRERGTRIVGVSRASPSLALFEVALFWHHFAFGRRPLFTVA